MKTIIELNTIEVVKWKKASWHRYASSASPDGYTITPDVNFLVAGT